MADWLSSMQQTYEYYTVDPVTWKDDKLLEYVTSCTINRDSTAETLGSATLDITEPIDEVYIRVYLVTIQNGVKEKHPLGTFLAQTPSSGFDGKVKSISVDAYTPLLELKEKQPPLGYSILKPYVGSDGKMANDEPIMNFVHRLTDEHARAKVVPVDHDKKLTNSFVANADDTWLKFLSDLMANAKYKFDLDEMGRIMFKPDQETAKLQPVWTYNDDNSSILQPDVTINRDIYGIPNVVEVIYSNGLKKFHSKKVNDDPNSPTSTVNRGREIAQRITDPTFVGVPSQEEVEEYATRVLKEASTIEYSVTYTHGYCPVRVGDCVMLNYSRAGLKHIKAKVVSQSIKCEPGCQVTEKVVFTAELWR